MSSYQIDTRKKYDDSYKKSVNNPETFWDELASKNFIWNKKWSKVVEWDFKKAKVSWFKDAKLNITTNCIDRHAKNTPDKTAIILSLMILAKKINYSLILSFSKRFVKWQMF